MERYLAKAATCKPYSYVGIFFGIVLSAAAFGLLIVPQGFAAGGVTGVCRVLQTVVPFPISAMVLVMNLVLLGLGYVFAGKEFVVKTMAVSVLFPLFLELFSGIDLVQITGDPLLCSLLAGVCLGVGSGLIIRCGASAGGLDVLAVILNKKTNISVARLMNLFDVAVILLQAYRQPVLPTVYGVVAMTVSAMAVDKVMTAGSGEIQLMVYSEKYEEIRQCLLSVVDVGMTYLHATTGYEQNGINVIVSVIPYHKLYEAKEKIRQIDPTAFVVIDKVTSVIGRGYTLDKNFAR